MVSMIERPDLESTEGLRFLLLRLAYSGPLAWRQEEEVSELIAFLTDKYAALAHKYGLEPADAAVAAFEVMRTRSARIADDSWAVITRAVQLTLIYEARAQGLLCSNQAARREELDAFHDAERFSDREKSIADFHPAFRVTDPTPSVECTVDEDAPTNAFFALDDAVQLFEENGWESNVARMVVEYVCSRLSRCGDRQTAYEYLRRDARGREQLELDQDSWIGVLRVMLGDPRRDFKGTRLGRGIMSRLCVGEDLNDLGSDIRLTSVIAEASPLVAGDAHV